MTDNQQYVELEEDLINEEYSDESQFLDPVMEPFNPADIDIVVEPKSLDALIKRIKHDEIDMNTDFQRHADLWDNGKMSRLIESILIRFPLPAFYFDASKDDNWLIVDGLQRLSAIRKFAVEKKLRLSGLEFLTDLNGKTFDQLHRQYQRRIEECPVTVYMIKPGTPTEVKYSVFRRINTGGLTLNNQEIRNALAKPRDRQLLESLANDGYSKKMLGDLSKRMKDQELVLRFWAFYKLNYFQKGATRNIASFLDRAMDDIKAGGDDYHQEFAEKHALAIKRCYLLLGDSGFEKSLERDSRRKLKNTNLYEVWMVSMAKLSESEFDYLLNQKDSFRAKVTALLKDNEFFDAITYSTQKSSHVELRYKKVKALIEEALND